MEEEDYLGGHGFKLSAPSVGEHTQSLTVWGLDIAGF